MNKISKVFIKWPNGNTSSSFIGDLWLEAALKAGVRIPTGCMGGSCGACEIDVNGKTLRACISRVEIINSDFLEVDFATDPYW